MTYDLSLAERRLKITARLMYQGMWLIAMAAALLLILRRTDMRVGSLWIFGCALLAFLLSFALRDVVRKVGHRNTENKLVSDVKSFLQNQPVAPVEHHAAPLPAPVQPVEEVFVPRQEAGFVPLKGAKLRMPGDDLVVFDAMPARENVAFNMNFHAVMMPVMTT